MKRRDFLTEMYCHSIDNGCTDSKSAKEVAKRLPEYSRITAKQLGFQDSEDIAIIYQLEDCLLNVYITESIIHHSFERTFEAAQFTAKHLITNFNK